MPRTTVTFSPVTMLNASTCSQCGIVIKCPDFIMQIEVAEGFWATLHERCYTAWEAKYSL